MLNSYDGPATITQGEERTDVTCSYDVVQKMVPVQGEYLEGTTGWRGRFSRVSGRFGPDSGEGTLELPDGGVGAIIVTRVDVLSGVGTFVGNREAPGFS